MADLPDKCALESYGFTVHHTAMKNIVRETKEQWDDVPAKVVGRRRPPSGGWSDVNILQHRINDSLRTGSGWPKGVYRFKSFEEADEWQRKMIIFPAK
jgi:hypothetical protein